MLTALQQRIEDLPNFRQGVIFTAFAEGWALNVEYEAKEAGLYDDDPYGDIGRQQGELFRSARLVVDTRLHAYGWTNTQDRHAQIQKLCALAERALGTILIRWLSTTCSPEWQRSAGCAGSPGG